MLPKGSRVASGRWRELLCISLALLLVGAVQLAGAFRDLQNLGARDWNYFIGQSAAEVDCLQRFSTFPAWSPWQRGGQPCLAQPEAMLLSPVTPLALLVGPVLAYKLLLLPTFLVCGLGLWALAGNLGLKRVARCVPALVLCGSSVFPLFLTAGLPNWLFALAILPWLFLAQRKAADSRRWVLVLGAAFAGLLFCGGLYQFVFAPIFLGAAALAQSLARRSLRPLAALGLGLLFGAALASPRLVPLADLHAAYPRHHASLSDGLPPSLLARVWLDAGAPHLQTAASPKVITPEASVYWTNVGAYVGPLGVLLAALGLCAGRKALWPLLLTVLGAWLAFGSTISASLWDALHALPLYSSMHLPQRLILFATFGLALLAGCGWSLLARLTTRWSVGLRRAATIGLLGALLVPMLVGNAWIAGTAFPLAPSGAAREPTFVTRRIPQREPQWDGPFDAAVAANVGNALAPSDVPVTDAVRAEGDADYRGEIFLANGNGTVTGEILPGRVNVRARLDADDTLVVNQNSFPDWRIVPMDAEATRRLGLRDGASDASTTPLPTATPGPLSADVPLLAVPLPAGEYSFALSYAPAAIPLGFLLGGLVLLSAAAWLLAVQRGVSHAGPFVGRLGAADALFGAAQLGVLATIALWLPPTAAPGRLVGSLGHKWVAGALRVDPSLPATDASDATYRDIERALADVPDGGALLLAPGRYPGVTLRRPVSLLAMSGADPVSFSGRVVVDVQARDAVVALIGPRDGRMVLESGLSVTASGSRCLLQGVRLLAERGADDPHDQRPALVADHVAWLQLVDVDIEEAPDLRPQALMADGDACSADAAVISGADGLLSRVSLIDRGRAQRPTIAPALLVRDGTLSLNDVQLDRARAGSISLRLIGSSAFAAGGGLGDVEADASSRLVCPDPPRSSRFHALDGDSVVRVRETPALRVEVLRFPYRAIVAHVEGRVAGHGYLVVSSLPHPREMDGVPDDLYVADFEDSIASIPLALDEHGRGSVRTRVPESLFAPGAGLVFQFILTGDDGPVTSLPDAHLFELLYAP